MECSLLEALLFLTLSGLSLPLSLSGRRLDKPLSGRMLRPDPDLTLVVMVVLPGFSLLLRTSSLEEGLCSPLTRGLACAVVLLVVVVLLESWEEEEEGAMHVLTSALGAGSSSRAGESPTPSSRHGFY